MAAVIEEYLSETKRKVADFWSLYRRNKFGMVGLVILLFFVFLAVAADYIAPYGQWQTNVAPPFSPPSRQHLLGADEMGRDLFSLFIYGSRVSLIIGITAALLSTFIGGLVGLISGYMGGWVDDLLMRVTEAFLAIPAIVLMIIFAAILGPSFTNIIMVIAIVSWAPIARIIRSQVLVVKELPYVEAARSVGAGSGRLMFKHIFPNVTPLLFANMILQISGAILAEAALSFLGLGDPHHTSWGMLLHYAYDNGALAAGYWWYVVPPGVGILLLVLSFVFIGYALDEIVNPRLRH